MKQPPSTPVGPVDGAAARLLQHCAIGRFVARHAALGLSVVRQGSEKLAWQPLDEASELVLPRAFERGPGVDAELELYHEALFERAARSMKLEWAERKGF